MAVRAMVMAGRDLREDRYRVVAPDVFRNGGRDVHFLARTGARTCVPTVEKSHTCGVFACICRVSSEFRLKNLLCKPRFSPPKGLALEGNETTDKS